MDPVLQQLDKSLNGRIDWQYRMGGLLPGWESFSDPVNAITRPIQMGPVWMHAAQVGNVPINHHIWLKDPPSSSYLACIAFKAVALQSEKYGMAYFRMMQKTCVQDGINISKYDALVQLAFTLKTKYPAFDTALFKSDLVNGKGKQAFQNDLAEVASLRIQRFPTMIIRQEEKPSLMIMGYRPYSELSRIFETNFLNEKIAG